MICRDCALIGDLNRQRVKEGETPYEHLIDCKCDCRHKTGAWEDFFDSEKLNAKDD